MALITKMENGDKTPTLYTHYGKQYDFDELQRIADANLASYILQQRRGSKHYEDFVNAYSDIMSGIKDGTITFNNGRYVDSTGRRKNRDGRTSKDFYGLMANYIYKKQGEIGEYVKPEVQENSTTTSTPIPKPQATPIEKPEEESEVTSEAIEETPKRPKTNEELFTEWLVESHPKNDIKYSPISLTVNDHILKDSDDFYNSIISKTSNSKLITQLILGIDEGFELKYDEKFYDLNNNPANISNNYFYKKILNQLYNNGQLGELIKGQAYYIPGTEKDESVLVWDKINNVLARMSTHDIPSYQEKYLQEYNDSHDGVLGLPKQGYENYRKYFVSSEKNGGILKALSGASLTEPLVKHNNLADAVFYDDDNLLAKNRYRHIYNDDSLKYDLRSNFGATDKHAPGNDKYDIELGGEEAENTKFYSYWKNVLMNNERVAKAWADQYKALQPQSKHYKNWYNPDGSFNFENFKSGDAGSHVYDDKVNGIGHDFYRGKAYHIDGEDENSGYYSGILNGYKVSDEAPTFDNDTQSYVYKLIKDAANNTTGFEEENGNQKEKSNIYPRIQSEKNNPELSIWGSRMIPQGLALARLMASTRANNRISDTIRKSLQPVLRDTYERYSPVVGDFGERQFWSRKAADQRYSASLPFTSDASLQAARNLEANNKSFDTEYRGFKSDNDRIYQTQQEALARTEDNMKRRSDVANFNRESINRTIREKAQLEASRKKFNWQSLDNYLKGTESKLTEWLKEDQDRRTNFRLQTQASDLDQRYQEAVDEFKPQITEILKNNEGKNPNLIPEYLKYKNYLTELRNWKNAQMYGIHANVYGYKYNNPYLNKDIQDIKYAHRLKQGGSLKPSIQYMINKVIRNENNS